MPLAVITFICSLMKSLKLHMKKILYLNLQTKSLIFPQTARRQSVGLSQHLHGRTGEHHFASVLSSIRADIDDLIRLFYYIRIVFNDHQRISPGHNKI